MRTPEELAQDVLDGKADTAEGMTTLCLEMLESGVKRSDESWDRFTNVLKAAIGKETPTK